MPSLNPCRAADSQRGSFCSNPSISADCASASTFAFYADFINFAAIPFDSVAAGDITVSSCFFVSVCAAVLFFDFPVHEKSVKAIIAITVKVNSFFILVPLGTSVLEFFRSRYQGVYL